MNTTKNYEHSDDLLDNSSLLSIYNDIICNHTIGTYKSDDLFSLDDGYDSNDVFSLNDASIVSVYFQRDNILQNKVAPKKDIRLSSICQKPNPRRWEKVKPVTPSYNSANLVGLDENFDRLDDSYDDDLSIESKADVPLTDITFSPHSITNEGPYVKKMRDLSHRIFPSYKDILLSKYFTV